MRNYRCPGTTAKVNLALSALPAFRGVGSAAELEGRMHIGPGIDYLERAFDASKYGEISSEPYLDITIPTLHDPSLAPAGAHVMSVYVQFAPYTLAGGRSWSDAAAELGQIVLRTLARVRAGHRAARRSTSRSSRRSTSRRPTA